MTVPSWSNVPDPLPASPSNESFFLEPLGPEHNERDHAAWMSSIEHIHATPGFGGASPSNDKWPFPMSLEANMDDLVMHAREFVQREAFAYSVLDAASDDVIGCVYIDPDDTQRCTATMRCWVRASHAALDELLAATVTQWLRDTWRISVVRPGRD
jgi:hypothetical protein